MSFDKTVCIIDKIKHIMHKMIAYYIMILFLDDNNDIKRTKRK